ncbi:polysaccharide biosynthesis/export family protein [Tamlana sp. 62-3]|uniref:Polysaccharide biosynthesis/export family protein n=1 Tax=Neotamlana sargassicola TaxID=2883125 RepID=A0A9X1I842_9FLAO|nr:polysaccharide biosynthesis/export family protein [Tamlana sargassicola]MCB4808544.1 polysaccharide biosynthesis/export family protein [Tamlana sargassicola]
MNKLNLNFKQFLLFLFISFLGTSCVTKKDIVYFQNAKDFETMVDTDTFEAKLKVGDIVSVYISTLNPALAQPYNLVMETGAAGAMVTYIIDVDGNIDYPVLGKIKLVGLTVEEAKELFKKKFKDGHLLKDPVVIIRILNYRVTIAGAVNRPGVYNIENERVTILEALGMAGDLSLNGKRDNVLVIRNQNGTKVYTRVDLTSKEIFNSPVFYLTQNDYVYVEPNNSAISTASGDRRLNTVMTITSFLLTTALIFVTVN